MQADDLAENGDYVLVLDQSETYPRRVPPGGGAHREPSGPKPEQWFHIYQRFTARFHGAYGIVTPPEQGIYHMVDGHKLGGLVVYISTDPYHKTAASPPVSQPTPLPLPTWLRPKSSHGPQCQLMPNCNLASNQTGY